MAPSFPTIFGRYELVKRLAVGGMAELFQARVCGEHGFKKTVVIKRILPHLVADKDFTQMFINEAKITAQLAHPKIAQTYELGNEAGQLFISMEYIDGFDTLALLRELARTSQQLSPEVAVYLVHEVVDALDYAHKQADETGQPLGVVHRDVSPSNILMSQRGDIKLVDFGIAQVLQQEHCTKAGMLKGKYGYMSPEQIAGEEVNHRSDLFAAGVVLAELLMGRRLFAASNEFDVLLMVRDVNLERLDRYGGAIDSKLMKIIRKALSKNSSQRFVDAAELRDVLDDWLFSNRRRVVSSSIAELVAQHLEGARARQEQAMNALEMSAQGKDVSSPTDKTKDIPPYDHRLAPKEVSGFIHAVALGEGELGESMQSQRAVARAPMGEAQALDERGDDLSPPLSSDATSMPTDDVKALAPDPRAAQSASKDASPQAEVGSVPVAVKPVQSSRFENIEAAVASLAIREPDPAARDFDDCDVAGPSVAPIKKKVYEWRPPTPNEILHSSRLERPRFARISIAPATSGSLAKISPMKLICEHALEQSNGLLLLEADSISKELFFVSGIPEFVTSNVTGELFGEYLVSQGIISEGELDMALAMMPEHGGKLGVTLISLGLVRPLDIFRHLTRQVREKLIDVCIWQRGQFSWYPGRENPRDSFPLDIDAFEVIGAGAMALPEVVINEWMDARGEQFPRALRRLDLPVQRFQLGSSAHEYFSLLNGQKKLRKLALSFQDRKERGRFCRTIFMFMAVGLAE